MQEVIFNKMQVLIQSLSRVMVENNFPHAGNFNNTVVGILAEAVQSLNNYVAQHQEMPNSIKFDLLLFKNQLYERIALQMKNFADEFKNLKEQIHPLHF